MREKANKQVREIIKLKGYSQWEVGELLNYGESSFSRLLRKQLQPEQMQEMILKIQELRDRK